MKKILLFSILMVALGTVSFAQSNPTTPVVEQVAPTSGAVMTLESDVVDYGTLKQHGEPLRKLKFTNTGTEPLVIQNARGSCGCTVPTWPKEPVLPGESGEIEIRYATNRLGSINKTVKITTNEGGEPKVIKVIGNILPADADETVPAAGPSILGGGM